MGSPVGELKIYSNDLTIDSDRGEEGGATEIYLNEPNKAFVFTFDFYYPLDNFLLRSHKIVVCVGVRSMECKIKDWRD